MSLPKEPVRLPHGYTNATAEPADVSTAHETRWALDFVRRWPQADAMSIAMWEQRLDATTRFQEEPSRRDRPALARFHL